MPTLGNLLAAVRHRLRGLDAVTDQVTELTAAMTETDTEMEVADTHLARGLYEVGFEQMRAKSAASDGTVALFTFGRGYNGTVATAHPQGSEVTYNPTFPASTIAAEINSVISSLYPHLYGVATLDVEWEPGLTLPDECVRVLSIYRSDTSDDGWSLVPTWQFHPDVYKGVLLPHVPFGASLRITYATRPGTFVLDDPAVLDADYASTTLLDDRTVDLVALGVAARLAPFIDLSRTTAASAEARADAAAKPAGQANVSARLLYSMFQQRLDMEAQILRTEHTDRSHKER